MLDSRFTIPAAVVVLPLALLAAAALLLHSGRSGVGSRLLVWRLAAVGYSALLLAVTFFPFQVDLAAAAASGPWWSGVNWLPVITIDARTFLLNILMTVPLGVLVPALTRIRTLGGAARAGLLLSFGIEASQLALGVLLGASRAPDVNDLIANTLGAVVGFAVFAAAAPALARLRVLPRPAPRPRRPLTV